MIKIEDDKLLEDKEMRQELVERVEILNKVKEIITLPNTKILTSQMVAEYYEISEDVVRQTFVRNKEELEVNGAKTLKGEELRDMKSLSGFKSRAGAVTVFSSRAILNMGMLLRDSKIAREVRNQLLNGFEKLSTKQKVEEIDREDALLLAIMKASTPVDQMIAVNELYNYNRRHKAELNARIDEMKPKEEAFDVFINSNGYQKMNDAAKSVGYGRNKLFAFLREQKVLMKDNKPYQSYIEREWFTVKQNTIINGSFTKNHAQTYVSPKGIEGISKMLKKHKLIK